MHHRMVSVLCDLHIYGHGSTPTDVLFDPLLFILPDSPVRPSAPMTSPGLFAPENFDLPSSLPSHAPSPPPVSVLFYSFSFSNLFTACSSPSPPAFDPDLFDPDLFDLPSFQPPALQASLFVFLTIHREPTFNLITSSQHPLLQPEPQVTRGREPLFLPSPTSDTDQTESLRHGPTKYFFFC